MEMNNVQLRQLMGTWITSILLWEMEQIKEFQQCML